MKKPTYKYPEFIQRVDMRAEEGKRYWLSLEMYGNLRDKVLVILKNPSRADKDISDKTVYNVSNYIFKNREKYAQLKNVGIITILNLIPHYQTDSSSLIDLKDSIIDLENIKTVDKYCGKVQKVIIAWGNHPAGLYDKYEYLKKEVSGILKRNNNQVFFVDRTTHAGNPKHGQVWSYEDELKVFKEEII